MVASDTEDTTQINDELYITKTTYTTIFHNL